MPLDPQVILLLILAAFAAGFVDAIAGGGGLITLPSLLMTGMTPVEAIATNKFQGTFGVATSTYTFWRAGGIDFRFMAPAIGSTLLGAGLGSLTVLNTDTNWLSAFMPLLLIAVAIYFAFAPSLGLEDRKGSIPLHRLAPALGFGIGFYDGFFGPGTGSFLMLGFVALGGLGLIKATANTKLLNFTSNLASLAVFAITGHITYAIAVLMAAGQMAGARLGAHLALRKGARIIRPMVVLVTLSIATKLLLDPQNPVGQWLRAIPV